MLEQVNVKLLEPCAEQYTPAALATLQLAGAGETSTRLEAVTPEAETEICEGALAEYSGLHLGLFKLTHNIKVYVN